MIDTLDYEKVPAGFTHCFNETCKLAGTCLRHQVARHIPETKRSVRTLNPSYVNAEKSCTEFISDTPVKYAYGWTHMFDKLIHEKAVAIKNELLWHYGKTDFYRLKRKEKSFTPGAQQYVRSVFRRYGVEEEPVYDQYQYEYVWRKE